MSGDSWAAHQRSSFANANEDDFEEIDHSLSDNAIKEKDASVKVPITIMNANAKDANTKDANAKEANAKVANITDDNASPVDAKVVEVDRNMVDN